MLKGKIHRAIVTQAELNYVWSITVDTELLEAGGPLDPVCIIHKNNMRLLSDNL